jgi:hypothetical protein
MLSKDEINNLLEKRTELKKELKIIYNKLKKDKCNKYYHEEDKNINCECCNKKINKSYLKKHNLSRTHILNEKIYLSTHANI